MSISMSEKKIEKQVKKTHRYWSNVTRHRFPRLIHMMVRWDMKHYHNVPKRVTQEHLNRLYPI